jgi:hypothetical protein
MQRNMFAHRIGPVMLSLQLVCEGQAIGQCSKKCPSNFEHFLEFPGISPRLLEFGLNLFVGHRPAVGIDPERHRHGEIAHGRFLAIYGIEFPIDLDACR